MFGQHGIMGKITGLETKFNSGSALVTKDQTAAVSAHGLGCVTKYKSEKYIYG